MPDVMPSKKITPNQVVIATQRFHYHDGNDGEEQFPDIPWPFQEGPRKWQSHYQPREYACLYIS